MSSRSPTRGGLSNIHVVVNGDVQLSQVLTLDLLEVTVHEDLDAPSMFVLRLVVSYGPDGALMWIDDDRLAVGSAVDIWMGYRYVDLSAPLIAGEVTGLEPEFTNTGMPTVVVRGYDRRHRLLRGRRTRSFSNMKDSDIAAEVLKQLSLSATVIDSRMTLEHVLQHNQTDMEFLQQRARQIGYELTIKSKRVLFRPRQHMAPAVLQLEWPSDGFEFFPRLTTLAQVGMMTVRSWHSKRKTVIVAQAAAGDENTTMGGNSSGPKAADAAFGKATTATVTRPVFSQAEAEKAAQAQFNELALGYISGEGTSVGRPDLRAGSVITIDGIGKRFSGRYYVVATRHTQTALRGYRTEFTVRRNAT